jgi:hypothetical protein
MYEKHRFGRWGIALAKPAQQERRYSMVRIELALQFGPVKISLAAYTL